MAKADIAALTMLATLVPIIVILLLWSVGTANNTGLVITLGLTVAWIAIQVLAGMATRPRAGKKGHDPGSQNRPRPNGSI